MAVRPQYVRGGEFVCNRDLDFTAAPNGRVFKVGDLLPWRELGLHEWQVCEFWKCNMVDAAPVAAAIVAPPVSRPAPVPAPRAPQSPPKHQQYRR